MSDWTRIRKRLKDTNTDYKIHNSKIMSNFIVEFGPVRMWFTKNSGLMVGLSIFDLNTNRNNKIIQYWSND